MRPNPLLFAATMALSACTTAGTAREQPMPPMPATLAVGQSLALPDRSTLRYVGVRDDSRCPPGVACIRAGEATVDFDHTPAGATAARVSVVVPDAPTARVGGWILTVERLAHGATPAATVRVSAP